MKTSDELPSPRVISLSDEKKGADGAPADTGLDTAVSAQPIDTSPSEPLTDQDSKMTILQSQDADDRVDESELAADVDMEAKKENGPQQEAEPHQQPLLTSNEELLNDVTVCAKAEDRPASTANRASSGRRKSGSLEVIQLEDAEEAGTGMVRSFFSRFLCF